MKPSSTGMPLGLVALAVVAFAPFLLMSERLFLFLPSEWWLRGAFLPALLITLAVPGFLVIDAARSAGATIRKNGLFAVALVLVVVSILTFLTILITLPAVASLALGGATTHQVTAVMNIVGGYDSPIRGCRSRAPIADRPSSFFPHVCFDSQQDKSAAHNLGPRVVVDLHGWGNRFGIFYTSTDPVRAADP